MIEILSNPMMIAVILMLVLCVLKINVFVSVSIAAMACALLGGADPVTGMNTFVAGLNGNIEVILSMLLFGVLANAMVKSGIGEALSPRIAKAMGKKAWIIVAILAILAVLSETFILIATLFVPIVVPPLLPILNSYKVDRRLVCVAIISGFQIGYACIPVGYGLIFQGIVRDEMAANGIDVSLSLVTRSSIAIAIAMLLAIALAIILFRKPRTYQAVRIDYLETSAEAPKLEWKHFSCIIAAIVGVIIQVWAGSMGLGAFAAVLTLVISGGIALKDSDHMFIEGMGTMAYISFVLMAASGFANVGRTFGDLDTLVSAVVVLCNGGKLISAILMLLLGLVITMGIGSSWGTVPIIAAVFVPMGQQLGFSASAIAMLIAAAAVLGDAGSPSSDQTLIPTAAFNLDGQHDHIYDTCIPSFLCDNISLFVVAVIAACVL